MITIDGYSKDTSIMPEGIVITWGKDLIEEKGGLLTFIRHFEQSMATEDGLWYQKCKNKPKDDSLPYVYIIVCGQVRYRCYYGGYSKEPKTCYAPAKKYSWAADYQSGHWEAEIKPFYIRWPHIILAGPFEKAPCKIYRKGFQGFRYSTKLF